MYLAPGSISAGQRPATMPSSTTMSFTPAVRSPADDRPDVAHEVFPRLFAQRIARLAGLGELVDAAGPLQIGDDVDAHGTTGQAGHSRPAPATARRQAK